MTYEEKNKLIEAENLLKDNCIKKIKGAKKCDCVFANGENCTLLDNYPCDWYTPKVSRWTPEDVALAKALKAVGATEICSTSSGRRAWRNNDRNGGYLPESAFRNMEYKEVIKIDDIIKEAEEDI